MGPIGCPETSIQNYLSMLHNIPEECRSHLRRGGSLKLRKAFCIRLPLLKGRRVTSNTAVYRASWRKGEYPTCGTAKKNGKPVLHYVRACKLVVSTCQKETQCQWQVSNSKPFSVQEQHVIRRHVWTTRLNPSISTLCPHSVFVFSMILS
jgi:hypothetical protein